MVQAQSERREYILMVEKVIDLLSSSWHENLVAESELNDSSPLADRVDGYIEASSKLFAAVLNDTSGRAFLVGASEDTDQQAAWATIAGDLRIVQQLSAPEQHAANLAPILNSFAADMGDVQASVAPPGSVMEFSYVAPTAAEGSGDSDAVASVNAVIAAISEKGLATFLPAAALGPAVITMPGITQASGYPFR